MHTFWTLVTILALSLEHRGALAFWRLPCQRSGLQRMDPIVFSGQISPHVHAVHGGSSNVSPVRNSDVRCLLQDFNLQTPYEELRPSKCTSCGVLEDFSAYWTPPLFFMFENGTVEILEERGGFLAFVLPTVLQSCSDLRRYYILEGSDIRAFPSGFQMVAGDTNRRNFSGPIPAPPKSSWTGEDKTQMALADKAVGFNCLTSNLSRTEPTLARHFLPNKDFLDVNCDYGLRLELAFPSCWNGVQVDAPDHKSHMAYPDLVIGGDCPDGFPIRTPTLYYETYWYSYAYRDMVGQFVLGNGDLTGESIKFKSTRA